MKGKLLLFFAMQLVAFQVLVSLPIAVWIHNQFNFSAVVWDSLGVFGLVFLVVSLLLFVIAIITPTKLRNYLLPLFVLGSALIYCQQYLLVWDYGVLDGTTVDFSINDRLGLMDLCLWLFGAVLYLVAHKKILEHSGTILLFTMLLTAVATTTTVLSYDFGEDESQAAINEIDKFNYSENRNIFLFLLDGFQSDLFWEIIDQDPQLREKLTGFTFYANTAGVYAKTYPTIPLLLTGRKYQKQQPFQVFLKEVYKDSVLTGLMNEGWDVGLYPYVKDSITLDSSIMSNYLDRTQWPEKVDNYLDALDISVFQSVPHSLKQYIYNDGDFITGGSLSRFLHRFDRLFTTRSLQKIPGAQPHAGLNFRDDLKARGTTNSDRPAFRFYHMFMPHEPYLLNRQLEFGRIGDDFSAYREYAAASLKLMISYLDELKNLGIYDNSSIIISADHGSGEQTNQKYVSSERRFKQVMKNGSAIASGKPLLLVKNYHASQPLEISSKPVSLLDVAPTVANLAGITAEGIDGKIIDEIEEGQPRERTYYYYRFSGWDSKYLNEFDVYKINGDVYEEDSWINAGKLTAQSEFENKETYELGSTMRFGSDAKTDADYSNAFLVGSGYKFTPSHVVANDGELVLSIGLESPLEYGETYVLEIDLRSSGQALNVRLDINRDAWGDFTVNGNHNRLVFLRPEEFKVSDMIQLRLHDPGYESDDGQLQISKVILQKANLAELEVGSQVAFSEDLEGFYLRGFWQQESWGRWASGSESSLSFRAPVGFCGDSYLVLDVNRFYKGVNPKSLEVLLNDRKLDVLKVENVLGRKRHYYDCSGPGDTRAAAYTLTLRTDQVQAPMVTGTRNDSRRLGVAISGMGLVRREVDN